MRGYRMGAHRMGGKGDIRSYRPTHHSFSLLLCNNCAVCSAFGNHHHSNDSLIFDVCVRPFPSLPTPRPLASHPSFLRPLALLSFRFLSFPFLSFPSMDARTGSPGLKGAHNANGKGSSKFPH